VPSLDTIRTVRIKGETDGVDAATAALNKLTASIQAANDNLTRTSVAAKESSDGWTITGEGALSAANHLRQAAEAAYAFSPAFRGVVNELAVPALQGAGTALEAVAAGIVTATNVSGTGIIRLGSAIETTVPALAVLGTGLKSAGAWMEAFDPAIASVATSILSRFLPALRLIGPALLIFDGLKLVGEAWDLGNAKLAEYVALSEKAASSGVSTDFYQRIAKAAEDAKVPVDQLTASFKSLQDATADQLGGTSAQNRLNDLVKAGNFKGNTGVAQLDNASSTEERFRAIASLIDQATAKGERLAALDVAKTFLGADVASNLAKDSDYLDRMLVSADAIRDKDLVSQASVDNAVALQARLDAAEQILSQRWHPIQDLLTDLGIRMKEVWVDIVEEIAKAVDFVVKLAETIANALSPVVSFLQMAEGVLAKAAQVAGNGLGPIGALLGAAGTVADTLNRPSQDALSQAQARLGAQLLNRNNITNAAQLSTGIESRVLGDTSKDPAKQVDEVTAAYDRATEAVQKYIETTNVSAQSVGGSVAEQEKLRVNAQLVAAAMKDGPSREAAEAKAQMSGLGDAAATAAQALEKAKVAADIKFNRNTALLSQEDVQIATQLKGLYPDVATALSSVEAQGIRVNNAFKGLSSSIESTLTNDLTDITTGAKSAGDAFTDMANQIIRAIEQMIIKILIIEPLMRSLQSAFSGGINLSGFGFNPIAGITGSANGNVFAAGKIVPFANGGIPDIVSSPTIAPMALFGEKDEEAIMPLRRGSDGKLGVAASGGGSWKPPAPANVVIHNYTGVQPTVSRNSNGDVTITLKKAVDGMVGDSMSNGSGQRVLRDRYGVKQFMGA
jgi:hypothetical protein